MVVLEVRAKWSRIRGLTFGVDQKSIYDKILHPAIQQPQKAQLSHLPWRNWLARSTVRFALSHFSYREVDSSSLSGRAFFSVLVTTPHHVLQREHPSFAAEQSNALANCATEDVKAALFGGWSQATINSE